MILGTIRARVSIQQRGHAFGHAITATRVEFSLIQVSVSLFLNFYDFRKCLALNDDACLFRIS